MRHAALRAGRALGIPVVYEIRAFWEDAAVGNGTGRAGSVKYRLTRALENTAVVGADAVLTICHGLRDDLVARGHAGGKIGIMPNGVDLTLFGDPPPRDDALAAELGLDHAGPVIGFIGSFYDYEGLDDLIAAMPDAARAAPRRAAAAGRRRSGRAGAARAGRGLARGARDPLHRPRAAQRGRALLFADRRDGLSAQGAAG